MTFLKSFKRLGAKQKYIAEKDDFETLNESARNKNLVESQKNLRYK